MMCIIHIIIAFRAESIHFLFWDMFNDATIRTAISTFTRQPATG